MERWWNRVELVSRYVQYIHDGPYLFIPKRKNAQNIAFAGIIGHSAFTESPVWTAVLDSELGPVLRVYEYDRYNGTVWQVDMLLLKDAFYAHPTITNPNSHDLRGYWWTCVAHHVTPESRIVTPAKRVAQNSVPSISITSSAWPHFAPGNENASFVGINGTYQHDNSFLGNILFGDYFVRIYAPERPYIAHVEKDGFTVVHGHPLNGTKFFTWGQTGPARFMQDFLAGGQAARMNNREGDYAELQV